MQGTGKSSPSSLLGKRKRSESLDFSVSSTSIRSIQSIEDMLINDVRTIDSRSASPFSQATIQKYDANPSDTEETLRRFDTTNFVLASDNSIKVPANTILHHDMLTHTDDANFIIRCANGFFREASGINHFKDFVKKNLNKKTKEIFSLYRQENPNSNFYHEVFNEKTSRVEFQKMTDEEIRKFIVYTRGKLKNYNK